MGNREKRNIHCWVVCSKRALQFVGAEKNSVKDSNSNETLVDRVVWSNKALDFKIVLEIS